MRRNLGFLRSLERERTDNMVIRYKLVRRNSQDIDGQIPN